MLENSEKVYMMYMYMYIIYLCTAWRATFSAGHGTRRTRADAPRAAGCCSAPEVRVEASLDARGPHALRLQPYIFEEYIGRSLALPFGGGWGR